MQSHTLAATATACRIPIVEDKFMFDDYPGEKGYSGRRKLAIMAGSCAAFWVPAAIAAYAMWG